MKKSVLFVADWVLFISVGMLAVLSWASAILVTPGFIALKESDPFFAGGVLVAASIIIAEFVQRVIPVRSDILARFVSLVFAWSLYNFGPTGFFTAAGALCGAVIVRELLKRRRPQPAVVE